MTTLMLPVSAQKRSMGSGARRSPLASPWPCSTRQPGVGGTSPQRTTRPRYYCHLSLSLTQLCFAALHLALCLALAFMRFTLRSPKPGWTRSRAPCGRGHHLLQQEGFRAVDEAGAWMKEKYFELFHAKGKSDTSAHGTTMNPPFLRMKYPFAGSGSAGRTTRPARVVQPT